MDKGLLVTKGLVNILCCVVPFKKWRKRLRYDLYDRKRRRLELVERGFKIGEETITTPEGIRIDITDKADHPLYMVKEVFIKSEYKFSIGKNSVLIDIGMNRGAASLLFASDENIKKIYSYEPFGPTFEKAKKNLSFNPELSEKIIANNCGLGKSETTLELPYISNASGAMSTTFDVCPDQKNTTMEKVVIKDASKEIGSIISENQGKHIIIKCDCEGAEFEIFERLNEEGLFGKIDMVVMEYHFQKPDRLVEILESENFVVQVKAGSKKSQTGYIYAVRIAERAAQ